MPSAAYVGLWVLLSLTVGSLQSRRRPVERARVSYNVGASMEEPSHIRAVTDSLSDFVSTSVVRRSVDDGIVSNPLLNCTPFERRLKKPGEIR